MWHPSGTIPHCDIAKGLASLAKHPDETYYLERDSLTALSKRLSIEDEAAQPYSNSDRTRQPKEGYLPVSAAK
jgi:hypothetical protein